MNSLLFVGWIAAVAAIGGMLAYRLSSKAIRNRARVYPDTCNHALADGMKAVFLDKRAREDEVTRELERLAKEARADTLLNRRSKRPPEKGNHA